MQVHMQVHIQSTCKSSCRFLCCQHAGPHEALLAGSWAGSNARPHACLVQVHSLAFFYVDPHTVGQLVDSYACQHADPFASPIAGPHGSPLAGPHAVFLQVHKQFL